MASARSGNVVAGGPARTAIDKSDLQRALNSLRTVVVFGRKLPFSCNDVSLRLYEVQYVMHLFGRDLDIRYAV